MLSLQIDDARLSDLEPWHADQLAALFRAHGADFYDWLPWEGFEDVDFAGHRRGFAQANGDQHAALRVEFGGLAEVVHAIEKPQLRRMRRRHVCQLLFDFHPHRHRIDAYGLTRQARDEQFGAVILLNRSAKSVRNLEPSLIIYFRRRIAPEHADSSTTLHKNPLR